MIKKTKIIHTPEILIIHLEKVELYEFEEKSKTYLLMITLTYLIFVLINSSSKTEYELFGVINHTGNVFGGHYYSHVKKNDDNWYLFNDQQIKRVSF